MTLVNLYTKEALRQEFLGFHGGSCCSVFNSEHKLSFVPVFFAQEVAHPSTFFVLAFNISDFVLQDLNMT